MNTTVEKNNPKNFPKNENSKGMVAPPVPPKSSQAKFAGIKAIFERNASHSQANDSNKTVSSNLGRTFGPTMQKLMKDNIHSTPNKQRRDSGDSGVSDVSSSTLDKKAKAYNPLDWNPILYVGNMFLQIKVRTEEKRNRFPSWSQGPFDSKVLFFDLLY